MRRTKESAIHFFHKGIAAVLALLLIFSAAGLSLHAQTSDGASVVVENAQEVEYKLYKIFSASTSTSEDTRIAAYTASAEQAAFFLAYDGTSDSELVNPFTFTQNAAGTYNVSITEGFTDEEVISFLKSMINEGISAGVIELIDSDYAVGTDSAGRITITWENLSYGYYYVSSSLGSVVIVTTDAPTATIVDKPVGDDEPEEPDEPDEPEEPEEPDEPDEPDESDEPEDEEEEEENPDEEESSGESDDTYTQDFTQEEDEETEEEEETTEDTLPQTGQLNWPIPFMALGGILLLLLGFAITRKDVYLYEFDEGGVQDDLPEEENDDFLL